MQRKDAMPCTIVNVTVADPRQISNDINSVSKTSVIF
jgi:hypothetical protein